MSEAIIVYIKNRRYPEAANLIVKSVYKEKIHTLGQVERDRKTRAVAKMIKKKHDSLRRWYADMNMKPIVIAEEVYNDIILELIPESTNHRPLSEQLKDEKP